MDVATLRWKVARGYGIAATKLGPDAEVFRPGGAGDPIVLVNRVIAARPCAIVNGVVGTSDAPFLSSPDWGKSDFAAMMDATGLEVGDYLRVEDQVLFIKTIDYPATPRAVRCNHRVTVKRPDGGTAGDAYYGGDVRSNEVTLITSWPAAVVQGRSGPQNEVGLPGDVRSPYWTIYLPASVPVQIRSSDVIEDDQTIPMRYIVSSVETTALGLRIAAMQAVA